MGVIPKVAVRKFLARERGDFRKWKKYRLNKLNAIMRAKLPVRPPIWKKLRQHQRVCLLLGALHGSWAFFLDTGCGKTLLSIALARYYKKAKIAKSFLVLVPNRINMFEWADEIEKHAPGVKYSVLGGTSTQKWAELKRGECLLYITTYMGLLHMVCKTSKTKKGKTKMVPWDKQINALLKIIDGGFLDESTELGNPESLTYRVCKRLTKANKFVYPLTGTPFGKDPKPLWAQMYLVDKGHSLGETLGLFRSGFYSETMNLQTGFPEYNFKKKLAPLLHDFIASRSIAYEADESDLPRLIPIIKEVPMSLDAEAHYLEANENFRTIITDKGPKNVTAIKNSFLRLRQISSGFIGYQDDETGERAALEFQDNPKLDMLMSILTEITQRHKAVVFCQFTYSGMMICRELKKLGIGHTRIYGKTKDQKAVLHEFKNDDKCTTLVLNNECGGFGLNLQIARYGIYFESPISPIMRKQTRRRVERQGSDHKSVFIYDLVTRGTYDHANLQALEAGKNLLEEVLRGGTKLKIQEE